MRALWVGSQLLPLSPQLTFLHEAAPYYPSVVSTISSLKLRTTIRVLVMLVAACKLDAQQTWNDPRTRALVERATERRASQLADTALIDYKATAHGYVTCLLYTSDAADE